MPNWENSVVSFLSGGAAGAVINHLFTLGRDGAVRRREYRGHITALILEIEGTPTHEVIARYQSSIPDIRVRSALVEDFVPVWKRDRFKSAWREYCSEQAQKQSRIHRGYAQHAGEIERSSISKENIASILGNLHRLS